MKNDLIYENEEQQDNAEYDVINEVKGARRDNQYVVENLNGTIWVNEKKEKLMVAYFVKAKEGRNWVATCGAYLLTENTPNDMITAIKKMGWTFKGWK